MSVHFDTFKEATYYSLKKMISGDVDVVINMIETLLQAQADDLENTFTNQKIDILSKRIEELEIQVDRLSR